MPNFRYKSEFQSDFVLGPTANAAALAATTAYRQMTVPAGTSIRLLGAKYYNATGFAANGSNYVALQVLKNATVAATWSTQTGQQGSLVAGADSSLVLSATDTNLVFNEGDTISFNIAVTGTVSLPAGQFVLVARWVK